MNTHNHEKLDCPVCGIPTLDMHIKRTARAHIENEKCPSGHRFAAHISGSTGIKVYGILEE